ncbi:phage holin family protein [Actinomadura darangshiensis]|uniref:Phage holin family protein n=1 Tax=Actinomadura darangshiensis TaxID=705336 RepID=A0A4R5BMX0_9ACTN|nr:phage holin family protein [Actinomadura darangshiensis]TDD87199.1 phage holin family protein [Actinomadura darangshiensis]
MSIVRQQHDGEGQAKAGAAGAHRQDFGRAPEFNGDHHEAGTGELVRQAAQQVSELMRAELRLAVAELKDKGRHAGTGAGMFGGAALVALYGLGVLLAAAVAAIAVALPVWAAALIIGVVLMLVAGVLAMLGRAQTKRAAPPKPERAMDEAKQAVAELKERATHR